MAKQRKKREKGKKSTEKGEQASLKKSTAWQDFWGRYSVKKGEKNENQKNI